MPDLHKMTATKGFTNPRIKGPRDGGAVLPGDTFETDFLHARELVAGQLAEANDPEALKTEPSDPLAPHHGLSVGAHAAINKRRQSGPAAGAAETKRDKDMSDRTQAAAAALERVQSARRALDDAEQTVKDKPSSAARAKLAEAQADYDAAETEAKQFTGT